MGVSNGRLTTWWNPEHDTRGPDSSTIDCRVLLGYFNQVKGMDSCFEPQDSISRTPEFLTRTIQSLRDSQYEIVGFDA